MLELLADLLALLFDSSGGEPFKDPDRYFSWFLALVLLLLLGVGAGAIVSLVT